MMSLLCKISNVKLLILFYLRDTAFIASGSVCKYEFGITVWWWMKKVSG